MIMKTLNVNFIRGFVLLAVGFLIAFSLQNTGMAIPEHFQVYIKEADKESGARLRQYEGDSLYRCYQEADGSITTIQTVEAYEEPMLIKVRLDDQAILEVEVLYENETDDYGSYVTEDWFLKRLLLSTEDKLVTVKRKKEKENEVIAITGATITSEAVVVAVNRSIEKWEAYQK